MRQTQSNRFAAKRRKDAKNRQEFFESVMSVCWRNLCSHCGHCNGPWMHIPRLTSIPSSCSEKDADLSSWRRGVANSPIPKSDGTWFIKTHFIVHYFGKNPMFNPNHTQIQCVKSARDKAMKCGLNVPGTSLARWTSRMTLLRGPDPWSIMIHLRCSRCYQWDGAIRCPQP